MLLFLPWASVSMKDVKKQRFNWRSIFLFFQQQTHQPITGVVSNRPISRVSPTTISTTTADRLITRVSQRQTLFGKQDPGLVSSQLFCEEVKGSLSIPTLLEEVHPEPFFLASMMRIVCFFPIWSLLSKIHSFTSLLRMCAAAVVKSLDVNILHFRIIY